MTKKIVGNIFVLASLALATALYSKGMFILPHLSGPTLLAVIGVILLTVKNKASKSVK